MSTYDLAVEKLEYLAEKHQPYGVIYKNLVNAGIDQMDALEKIEIMTLANHETASEFSGRFYNPNYIISGSFKTDISLDDINCLYDAITFRDPLDFNCQIAFEPSIDRILNNLDNYSFFEVEDIVDSKGNTMKIFCQNPSEEPNVWIQTGYRFALKGIATSNRLQSQDFDTFKSYNADFEEYFTGNDDDSIPNIWIDMRTPYPNQPFYGTDYIILFNNEDRLVQALRKEKTLRDGKSK